MNLAKRKKGSPLCKLRQYSLKELGELKRVKASHDTLSKLKQLRSTYEQGFYSLKPKAHSEEELPEYDLRGTSKRELDDFQRRCWRICEQMCFHLSVFEKIYKQNHRKKSILVKLYGWNRQFQQVFFIKGKEQLRPDLSPAFMFEKFDFTVNSFNSRNTLNKLRLFLNELIGRTRRQQELQSKFMKTRLSVQLGKLNKEIVEISTDKQKKHMKGYIEEIGRTHEMMLNLKVKNKNQMQALLRIEQETGRIQVNQFYGKEEGMIDEMQKYFTTLRVGRRV